MSSKKLLEYDVYYDICRNGERKHILKTHIFTDVPIHAGEIIKLIFKAEETIANQGYVNHLYSYRVGTVGHITSPSSDGEVVSRYLIIDSLVRHTLV